MNRVCELLGIEHPILQGGMTWVSDAPLVSAVSNAGGLGIIGAGAMPVDLLRYEIRKTKGLTDKPFGVNLVMINPEFEPQLEVILEELPDVLTLGAVTKIDIITKIKAKGIKVIPVLSAVAMAKRAEQAGAAAIIAEGSEAGGHIGETTTMVLTPLVADAVAVPVIAAGGIADGRGMAAAFMLGAEGVQMGTRFVCAEECTVHEDVKAKFVRVGDRATKVTSRATGFPVRAIKNKLAVTYEELEKKYHQGECSIEDIENLGLGKLREAMREGNVRDGSLMAGQCVAMVCEIQPVEEIIREIQKECEQVIDNMNGYRT